MNYSDVHKQTVHSEETCKLYFCFQFKALRIKLNIVVVSSFKWATGFLDLYTTNETWHYFQLIIDSTDHLP